MSGAQPVEVAAGILIRPDGACLLAQRPAGKPYAGYWEFPGGKLEAAETIAQALRRELHEELGIDLGAVCSWVTREHVYPHAHVRLHFCRVYDWCGQPVGREGQDFGFFFPSQWPTPLLDGALPVMPWLGLPDRCRLARSGTGSLPSVDELQLVREPDNGDSAWWIEPAGSASRRGCLVDSADEAANAVQSGADFLIARDGRSRDEVLRHPAVPVFLLPASPISLAAARRLGAHGLAAFDAS